MNEYSSFIEIIKEFIQLFEALVSVEQTKLDAAVNNKVSFVEECMNKEQAAVLKLKGLEQKREDAQKTLGFEDFTFRQILEHVPEDVHSELSPLFDQLSGLVQSFQSVSDSAKDIIELNLHMIQSAIVSREADAPVPSGKGKKDNKNGPAHFTSRSV